MRQSRAVADHLQRGLGVAARRLGDAHDVFRPRTSGDPLVIGNRLLTLTAAFDVPDGRFRRAPGFGAVVWQGIFDAAYTKPGDYLSGPNGCFFVALQLPLLPPVCVRATRVVTVARPAPRERVGPRSYGGVLRADAEPILRNWPVSLAIAGARLERDEVGLPGDGGEGTFVILLPPLPAAAPTPRVADLVSDDHDLTYVIGAVEQGPFGWRLIVRQANC
jgi:hypothetical protein